MIKISSILSGFDKEAYYKRFYGHKICNLNQKYLSN